MPKLPLDLYRSFRGVQYTALSFAERLKEVGIRPSMGRTGSALDKAMAESFVSTLKAELVSRLQFPTRRAAKTAIFEYLETFYNTRRLHWSLGYRSLWATGARPTSRRINWKRSGSRKANVSVLAGESHTITPSPLVPDGRERPGGAAWAIVRTVRKLRAGVRLGRPRPLLGRRRKKCRTRRSASATKSRSRTPRSTRTGCEGR